MREDMLLQIFNEETSGKKHADGQRVLNNDLVTSLNINCEDNVICIGGNVISENLFNEYTTKIEFDTVRRSILSTYCSCQDFEKNELKKNNYCCKHLVATYYKSLSELAKHPLISEMENDENGVTRNSGSILSMLLGNGENKEELKFEIFINRNEWSHELSAEFKIGLISMSSSNLYVLKDINQFLVALYNNIPITFSKNFSFNMKEQKLSSRDRRIVEFIETLKSMDEKNKMVNRDVRAVDGKYINIPKYFVREFFDLIKKHRVYLNEGFFSRPVETEIVSGHPPVDFDLKLIKDEYVLKSPGGMPVSLGAKNDTFLYGSTIYLPDYDLCYRISPYLQVFNQARVITFPKSEEETVLRKLIPALNLISESITLSNNIKEKIVFGNCGFSFYFDMQNRNINLTLKVNYGGTEFNIFRDYTEKIIYRDKKKEAEVIALLRTFGFEAAKDRFYLLKEDDYIFRFFKYDIEKLQTIGDVYYSENFKSLKSIGDKGINGEIKSGKYDYFELKFNIGDISPQETSEILRAFRDNLKYYRLKTGEFIDLEELELNKFLKLLDSVAPDKLERNIIEINKNKSLFLESYLQDEGIRYFKGKKELEKIKDMLKSIGKPNFPKPLGLHGELREYQKTGYNWFKTLDYLGFGGILGDEMGLGKTLQAIAFILSNKCKKHLIVAPTSLIYNWISEFFKFAPSVKVAAVNGLKGEREEIIRNYSNYDVLITTYNLLRRDLECYETIEFDYCFLDEAQYIKNANSQNAQSVKMIKSKRRFALSGTPMENSLMELWSIFDFIMPGYLYDEKRFSVRYHKRLREEPEVIEELNRLIRPFILRRRKKDVIKELPDKIEKTLVITMEKEQSKVYKTYASYAVDLIQKKVRDEEFKNSKIEILSYLTKLRQICLDPSVVMEEYKGGNAKLDALMDIMKESIEGGHRVLVFSQFTSILKNIIKRFNEEKISFNYLDGSITSEKRMRIVEDFNNGESSVFLISLKAGGTGLNLTSADIVIHFDPWWNPAVEEQAADRAHRIGQKNIVEVIKIITKGTIEEKILALQEDKKKLISELIGDGLSKGQVFNELTEDEILGLFEENISWV